ncbi:MAG TPA: sulfide/dihydroorotate dehydrogenase-like FAD/NAD-binding protein [candidate division Zixibacteria bacterium]|nr:sulfide/dihydroorotate dehydrogenase-like FAD/NAD-binding protein [candidate division Zixibacteria bacterium]
MFKVISNEMVVPNIHLLTVEAPAVAAQIEPGQFVILRSEEDGERIPLSIADWDRDKGTLTFAIVNVGGTTDKLASLRAGTDIPTVVGPLGNATEIGEFGTVVCIGGCYGIGSIYPIARALKEKNNRVITIIEARSSYLLFWEDKYKQVSDKFVTITRDGSRGVRGHITHLPEILGGLPEPANRIIVNGCTFLMKHTSEISRPFGIKTIVSLNPIMIDGTGMCGVCRVSIASKTKFACVDGPDFDGHEVDWAELLQRRKTYIREEAIPLRTSKCEEHAANRRGNIV